MGDDIWVDSLTPTLTLDIRYSINNCCQGTVMTYPCACAGKRIVRGEAIASRLLPIRVSIRVPEP